MSEIATLETFMGDADAHRLASEALALGQALDVDNELLATLFIVRGLAAAIENRYAEAVADLEYAARRAEPAGDTPTWSRALLNLASVLTVIDPVTAEAAARTAVDLARRIGARYVLPTATSNLISALLFIGDWSEADHVLNRAIGVDGFNESLVEGQVALWAAVLPGLRGDQASVPDEAPGLTAMRASEDIQDLAVAALFDTYVARACGQRTDALRHARAVVGHTASLGVATDIVVLAWTVGVRVALELRDSAAVDHLLAVLDEYPVGHIPPLLRAERNLARARLREATGAPDAAAAIADAVDELRAVGSPYYLAHGLLDLAESLDRSGADGASTVLRDEARTIGERLGAPALIARAGTPTTADLG
jgi:tetratricopeptide (TPR) repeat protein